MEEPVKLDGSHDWFLFHGLTCCRSCGLIKRAVGENNPCVGRVRVALRDTAALTPRTQGETK